jgi:peptidyl-dipeptidase Dcp
MEKKINLDEITIRTELRSGDIGYIIYLHGKIYKEEYNYGIQFETYVAEGLCEFYKQYNPEKDRVWICEHNNKIIGFLLLLNRGKEAQLRYFLLKKEYRGIGLGNKLINLFLEFLKECKYVSAYLLTTDTLIEAAHLYTKYGFKLVEENESTAFGRTEKEQRYEIVLNY